MRSNFSVWMVLVLSIFGLHVQEAYAQEDKTKRKSENALDSTFFRENNILRTLPERFKPEKQPFNYELNRLYLTPDFQVRPDNRLKKYYKYAVPVSFVAYGALSRAFHPLKELDQSIHEQVEKHMKSKVHADDFLQYAPALAVYAIGFGPIKPKHNFRDRTFVMATSHLLMAGTVQLMKRTIHAPRPDGRASNSFPSGHTATAFTGAHILFREYKDESMWIGVAGYATASATGIMRILNKRHWLSDVVTGAGIGILCVEASYLLLPVFHNILGIKQDNKVFAIAPMVYNNNYGVSASYTF